MTRVAGVLSGTSLDGIDVAIVDVARAGDRYRLATRRFATVPFEPALRARIAAAYPPAALDALTFSRLHADVGDAFGAAVRAVAGPDELDLVASHGLTLAHDGAAHHSLQIGDAFRIRERTGTSVAYDFRAADCAAGGHGAPLVPYLDALVFGDDRVDRVALNLGGIANITVLTRGVPSVAFDSGPANLPSDLYVRRRALDPRGYDRDGGLAARGTADAALLERLLDDPYFAAAPPKSTGREAFGAPYVARHAAALDALAPADALATLAALTVRTVTAAIEAHAPAGAGVVAAGGGVHNRAILAGLRTALPARTLVTSDAFGVDPDAKEAVLFALLGVELFRGRAANVVRVTGARGPRVLGAIAPHAGFERVMAALGRGENE